MLFFIESIQTSKHILIFLTVQISNLTPCASGSVYPKLKVQVALLIYCFHESEPDSRPPPVSFSPPKAPPISAPDVPMLTLTIPQSDPIHSQIFHTIRSCPSVSVTQILCE